jgi:hypothetical protein
MKLKFLLWVALSLTFTEDFTACGYEKVIEELREVEEEAKEVADILEFAPTSESTVEMTGIKDKFRTEITIPSTIQIYGKEYKVTFNGDAFTESNVKNVKITEGFTEIPEGAFSFCSGLTSIEIPASVTSIRERAFEGCSGLTSIEISSSVISIGKSAFSFCSGLTSIEIPSSVTSIGGWAFYGCQNADIVIDNSEENVTVGRNAFRYCKSVTWKK